MQSLLTVTFYHTHSEISKNTKICVTGRGKVVPVLKYFVVKTY